LTAHADNLQSKSGNRYMIEDFKKKQRKWQNEGYQVDIGEIPKESLSFNELRLDDVLNGCQFIKLRVHNHFSKLKMGELILEL